MALRSRAELHYVCRLMNRKMEIGSLMFKERRGMNPAEELEIEWINIRMQLVHKAQLMAYH